MKSNTRGVHCVAWISLTLYHLCQSSKSTLFIKSRGEWMRTSALRLTFCTPRFLNSLALPLSTSCRTILLDSYGSFGLKSEKPCTPFDILCTYIPRRCRLGRRFSKNSWPTHHHHVGNACQVGVESHRFCGWKMEPHGAAYAWRGALIHLFIIPCGQYLAPIWYHIQNKKSQTV